MSTQTISLSDAALLPTYTEVQGVPPFDWHAFLAQPNHHDDEWHLATNLAGEWVSCACGNQCSAIPRELCGAPQDEQLYELGCAFARQIMGKDMPAARLTLDFIERRSALVLAVQAALSGKEQPNA